MARIQVDKTFEALIREGKATEFDATVLEIFQESITAQIAGSRTIKRGVAIPSHIRPEELEKGMRVRLGLFEGQYVLLEIFKQLDKDPVYANKGLLIPDPPAISVEANCDSGEWEVTWFTGQPGIDHFILYWATDAQGSNSETVVETEETAALVPFDQVNDPPHMYFAVRAVGDVEGALSYWATDSYFLNRAALVIFGDTNNHGHVESGGAWWRCEDGALQKSTNQGASWDDENPGNPPDTWSQNEAPTAAAAVFQQVVGDDDELYVLVHFEDSLGASGGWLLWTDDGGDSWAYVPLYDGITLPNEVLPLWADFNTNHVVVSTWFDDGATPGMNLMFFDRDGNYESEEDLGAASKANVESKTLYAFPVVAPDDADIYYLAGRMDSPGTLSGIVHVAKYDDDAGTWATVENGWGTDICSSLKIRVEGGSRKLRGVRQ